MIPHLCIRDDADDEHWDRRRQKYENRSVSLSAAPERQEKEIRPSGKKAGSSVLLEIVVTNATMVVAEKVETGLPCQDKGSGGAQKKADAESQLQDG